MEYAADGHYEDGATFNVINRDLPVPKFSTTDSGGWLVITTDQLTLRYQDGSGPFGPSNTSISVNVSDSTVIGHPSWPPAPGQCPFGARCEAEDGRLNGGESVNYDHTGFTGRGFAADYGQVSASDGWTITDVPATGDYTLQVRYANGGGHTRTLSASADGSRPSTLTLPATANWDTWGVTSMPVHLTAGTNTISTTCAAGDGCNVNLDSVAITADSTGDPTTTGTTPPPV